VQQCGLEFKAKIYLRGRDEVATTERGKLDAKEITHINTQLGSSYHLIYEA
jgi:hypothetical protein